VATANCDIAAASFDAEIQQEMLLVWPYPYPELIRVARVAHALHRVCETIRVLYPNVDKLLANGMKIFVKSPARIELFKNKAPDIPLPPTPVITRWGT
jgi:hypothetical protein